MAIYSEELRRGDRRPAVAPARVAPERAAAAMADGKTQADFRAMLLGAKPKPEPVANAGAQTHEEAMQLLESSDGSAIVVSAGDWVQITVQFTKLSMHVAVEPADSPVAAAGRRLQHESSGVRGRGDRPE